MHLAERLDLPMAERNRLLRAGGFAPAYLEAPFEGDAMRRLRESLRRLAAAHEPIPTLIVDGLWNVIEANRAASLLWDGIDPAVLEPPVNMLRLAVDPGGLPSIPSMTTACNAPLIHRLRRKSREDADDTLRALVDEVSSYLPRGRSLRRAEPAHGHDDVAYAARRPPPLHRDRDARRAARGQRREPRDRDVPPRRPRERRAPARLGA